jgi:hypothetical protein
MKQKILIHTCCAPCLASVYDDLKEKYEIICYFYNPNIQPSKEYKNRKEVLIEFCKLKNIEIIFDDSDNFANWLDFISINQNTFLELQKDKNLRCEKCYEMRLIKTAQKAKDLEIKNITTTLLYSIYQYHDLLKNLGYSLSEKYNLNFHYEDFRVGWQKGCEIYKKTGLFRQNYCGCIFSEYERFHKIL